MRGNGGAPWLREQIIRTELHGGRAGARWLIDGMNLIGSRPDRWWNDPDRAVRRLIQELDRYAAATGEDVTVVFDRGPPDVQPGRHGTAMVAFAARAGRNAADDEIVRVLAADPAPGSVRVVTSDKRLAERARLLGARVRSSAGFRRRLDEVAGALTDGT
jgi:predicted RNA-binding protein with PIN domain